MENSKLEHLVTRHKQGWGLEQPFYTSQEIFDFEWKAVWKKYWLFAGTTAEIPKAGDFFTYNANHDSIIVIRGDKGQVHAHYNSCRHRGSLVCLEESGNVPKLMCPYHQWVYNKDGSLFRARLMPDDFDKSSFGLHAAHVKVANGLIFISLADSPPDFEKVSAD